MMEQGAAPAGVSSSLMPPGRSGLAGRSYYDGLQVDLLDADWTKAGQSLPDRDGRGSFCPGPEDRLRSEKSPPNKAPAQAQACAGVMRRKAAVRWQQCTVYYCPCVFRRIIPLTFFLATAYPAPQRTGAAELCFLIPPIQGSVAPSKSEETGGVAHVNEKPPPASHALGTSPAQRGRNQGD